MYFGTMEESIKRSSVREFFSRRLFELDWKAAFFFAVQDDLSEKNEYSIVNGFFSETDFLRDFDEFLVAKNLFYGRRKDLHLVSVCVWLIARHYSSHSFNSMKVSLSFETVRLLLSSSFDIFFVRDADFGFMQPWRNRGSLAQMESSE
jgi:hypothetical protein